MKIYKACFYQECSYREFRSITPHMLAKYSNRTVKAIIWIITKGFVITLKM